VGDRAVAAASGNHLEILQDAKEKYPRLLEHHPST
jgi:hypothetical protein